jgi:hypothetical protein
VSHLGRWLSALVDGELADIERDRVLNHVAGCTACRQEANAMRALKRRLTALGDTCAESPIAGRLIELARDQGGLAGGAFSLAPWPAAALGPQPGDALRPARLGWKIATGSATSALLAVGVIAFLLGNASGTPPVPKVTPSVDSLLVQHSYDAGQERAGSAPVAGPVPAGGQPGSAAYWSRPATQARLDPRRPGTVQLGQLSEPVRPPAGPAPAAGPTVPGPIAPAPVSPSPFASATASPVASAPASPGHSSHPHPASRSSR